MLVKVGGLRSGHAVQGVFVDCSCALVLLELGFVTSISNEQFFVHEIFAHCFNSHTKDLSDMIACPTLFLETGPFDPVFWFGVDDSESLEY